jgi:hypothetical protein
VAVTVARIMLPNSQESSHYKIQSTSQAGTTVPVKSYAMSPVASLTPVRKDEPSTFTTAIRQMEYWNIFKASCFAPGALNTSIPVAVAAMLGFNNVKELQDYITSRLGQAPRNSPETRDTQEILEALGYDLEWLYLGPGQGIEAFRMSWRGGSSEEIITSHLTWNNQIIGWRVPAVVVVFKLASGELTAVILQSRGGKASLYPPSSNPTALNELRRQVDGESDAFIFCIRVPDDQKYPLQQFDTSN